LNLQTQKAKCKFRPGTGHEGTEGEKRCSSTISLTSALDGGGWSTPRPSRCNPGKDTVPTVQKASGPQGRSGQLRKISPPPRFDLRPMIQPQYEINIIYCADYT